MIFLFLMTINPSIIGMRELKKYLLGKLHVGEPFFLCKDKAVNAKKLMTDFKDKQRVGFIKEITGRFTGNYGSMPAVTKIGQGVDLDMLMEMEWFAKVQNKESVIVNPKQHRYIQIGTILGRPAKMHTLFTHEVGYENYPSLQADKDYSRRVVYTDFSFSDVRRMVDKKLKPPKYDNYKLKVD